MFQIHSRWWTRRMDRYATRDWYWGDDGPGRRKTVEVLGEVHWMGIGKVCHAVCESVVVYHEFSGRATRERRVHFTI
jgi:hypothetical protein